MPVLLVGVLFCKAYACASPVVIPLFFASTVIFVYNGSGEGGSRVVGSVRGSSHITRSCDGCQGPESGKLALFVLRSGGSVRTLHILHVLLPLDTLALLL